MTKLARLDDFATRLVRVPLATSVEWATGAYATFMMAIAYQRLGAAERAKGLAESATNALAASRSDPLHRWLTVAFGERFALAVAGMPRETPMSSWLLVDYRVLGRVHRLKADLLRERSRLIEAAPERVDARGDRALLRTIRPPMVDSVPRDVAALDALVAAALASTEAPSPPHLAAILDRLRRLPEAQAIPILVQALPLLDRVTASRPALYRRALSLAGRFGWGELVPPLFRSLMDVVHEVHTDDLAELVDDCTSALDRLGFRDEMAAFLGAVERIKVGERLDYRVMLALATGYEQLRDPRGARWFAYVEDSLDGDLTEWRLQVVGALASASWFMRRDAAAALIARLAARMPASDVLLPCSHYHLAMLTYVDAIVSAIVERDDRDL